MSAEQNLILDVQGGQAYCDTGGVAFDASRPCVVFIHGALNDHAVWERQARHLAAHGFGVLAVDLPGHGGSTGPALASVEAMAAWLLALLDAARVKRALLVGHSMGSLVALHACHLAPQRVAALALAGATFPMPVAAALLEAARSDEQGAIEMITDWSHSTPDSATREATRRLMQRVARAAPGQLLHADLAACNAYAEGETAARSVRCPTLLLFGSADRMTPPRKAVRLREALEHAEIVSVDAGHAMMAEQPDAVCEALFAFAAKHS
jgi:pimeloyl-ACP methyl ester carboxylesterase